MILRAREWGGEGCPRTTEKDRRAGNDLFMLTILFLTETKTFWKSSLMISKNISLLIFVLELYIQKHDIGSQNKNISSQNSLETLIEHWLR